MPEPAFAMAALRRIAEACRAGRPPAPADAQWLAERLEAYEVQAPSGETLDKVLGIATPPGGRPWWWAEARRERDRILRQLARMFYPGRTVAEQAAEIGAAALRYRTSAWRWDRHARGMPEAYWGTARGLLFEAFRAAPVPLSARQLQTILAGDECNELGEVISSQACES